MRERERAVRKTTGHLTGSCGETPEPRNPRLVLFQIQHERVCVCVCVCVCVFACVFVWC